MDNSKISSAYVLRISACFIFDIAIILAFFKLFGLFFIFAPDKSILILFVLLLGLMILNVAVIFPNMLFKSIGMPYSASIVTLMVLYVIVSNVFSIFLIPGNIVWYIVWQLIILAVFIGIFSVIAVFSKTAAEDIIKIKKEQADKNSIMMQLLEIEGIFTNKETEEDIMPMVDLFKALKERIQASTPFGRINGNRAISDIENQIKNNLIFLQAGLQGNLTHINLIEMKRLLEDTRRLVINRETLNIK